MSDALNHVDPNAEAQARTLAEIERLGLNDHLLELETQGYTIIKGVLSEKQINEAKRAIHQRAESIVGHSIDLENETGEGLAGMQYLPYLLYDDEIFEEIMMAEKPLALMTWLLGESCLLSSIGCHFRAPGGMPLMLHSDNGNGMPAPFSPISMVANINYALTPYSKEAGALCMVPGSHRLCRQPLGSENFRRREDEDGQVEWRSPKGAVTMDIEPGDAVVWHGNTWHGSYVRELEGVRMNLAVYMNRQHIQTQERHGDAVPAEVLERHANNPRFLTLLGGKQPYGWQSDGPDYSVMAKNPRGQFD